MKTKIPWHARLAFAILGCLPLAIAVMAVQQLERPQMTVAGFVNLLPLAFGVLLAGAFSAGLFWLAFCYRELSPAELESLDTSPLPPLSDDALVTRFHFLNGCVRRVVVDFGQRQLHFQRCHTPRKFLAVPQMEFRCTFANLVDVHRCQNKGDSLIIVTNSGKAIVPSTAIHYEALCARLPACLPEQRPVIDSEHPLMGILYVAAALAGLFGGLALTPRNGSALLTGTLMAIGAGAGIILIRVVVVIINARTGRSVVPPCAGSLLGAGLGWFVGQKLADANHWDLWAALIPVALGGLAGFIVGLKNSKRILLAPIEP